MKTKQLFAVGMAALMLMGCGSSAGRIRFGAAGITSVREALYQRDNVYLICTFDKGLEYLTSLYENTTCAEVDRAGLFHIYKLQSL